MSNAQGVDTKHTNNFGLLRLFFAALVIVSHSPELVDGNRSRELLTRMFGTMSLGEVSVDAFFLVSGYLISQSFARTPSPTAFAIKRAGRILPGYLAVSALCFFVLAPLVGSAATLSAIEIKHFLGQSIRLLPPYVAGTFAGLPYTQLNGSMWTIAYEARCYAAVALAGIFLARMRGGTILLTVGVVASLAIAASRWTTDVHLPAEVEQDFGQIGPSIRFAGVFGAGALFYLLRNCLPLTLSGGFIAALLLLTAMPFQWLAEPAVTVCGGYLVFYVAFRMRTTRVSRWADRTDISYGLYLYAWPVGNTIVYLNRGVNPWLLCVATLGISTCCGLVSWYLVEKPAIGMAQRLARRWSMSKQEFAVAKAAAA